MPKLVFRGADGVEQSLDLGADPVLIGRLDECQVRTQDAAVSRRHARIFWDGGYFVEDLGSSNGVFVRGERVQRAPLRPGDDVRCGSLAMRLLPEAVWVERTKSADALPPPAAPPVPAATTPPMPPRSTPPRSFDATPPMPPPAFEAAPPPPAPSSAPAAGNDAALLAAEQRATRAEAKLLDAETRAAEAERKLSSAEAQAQDAMERTRLAEQASGDGERLRRQVEQLRADLRRARGGDDTNTGGGGGEAAGAAEAECQRLRLRVAELEAAGGDGGGRLLQRKVDQLTAENRRLRQGQPVSQVDGERIAELEARLLQAESASRATAPAPSHAETDADAERTRRMIEQLTAENRRLRQGNAPTPPADDPRIAELQTRLVAAERERDALRATPRAAEPVPKLGETLGLVDDALADLRGSLRAASDEVGVLGAEAPSDSVEVLRDALSAAQEQAESARAKVKELRARVGVPA